MLQDQNPYVEQESELQKKRDRVWSDYLASLRSEADRHKVDPKRERWSAIASAVGGTISGIAGAVGVSNGAIHPKPQPVSTDYYDEKRRKRREALDKYYEAQKSYIDAALADIAQRRKRIQEEKTRAINDRYYTARAEGAEQEAKRKGTLAEYEPQQQEAKLDKTQAQTENAKSSAYSRSHPQPKAGQKTQQKKVMRKPDITSF